MSFLKNKQKARELWRFLFFAAVVILCGFVLFRLPRLTIPLAISYVLYLMISPFIPKIMKMGLSRGAAVAAIFVAIAGLSVYPIVKIVPVISQETENFQYYIPKIESYLKKSYSELSVEIKNRSGYELDEKHLIDVIKYGKNGSTAILLGIPKILASLLEWFFLVPLLLFFMLKDGQAFRKLALKLVPNAIFERVYYLSHQFNKQLGDYIFAKFIEASIVGFIITVGLLIMGVSFSFLLGLIAGLTNVIPYLGPILGVVPAIIWALVEYGAGPTLFGILILYTVANVIDLALVFPILVSKIVNLHPIVVVISVIVGSQYLGVAGLVVSIPLAAAVKLIVVELYNSIYSTHSS